MEKRASSLTTSNAPVEFTILYSYNHSGYIPLQKEGQLPLLGRHDYTGDLI